MSKEKEKKEQEKIAEENPWESRFLPEGWNLLGQCSIKPLAWDGTDGEIEELLYL